MTTHALDHQTTGVCLNCDAHASGNFGQHCGQETVLHPPSIAEFLHEFIGHYVALEGRLWQTLKLLLLRPGRLTLEYLAGRRVRYIQPLRVYLTFSLIFFALFKFMGDDHQVGGVKLKGIPVVQMEDDMKPRDRADLRAELNRQNDFKENQDDAPHGDRPGRAVGRQLHRRRRSQIENRFLQLRAVRRVRADAGLCRVPETAVSRFAPPLWRAPAVRTAHECLRIPDAGRTDRDSRRRSPTSASCCSCGC